MGIGLKISFDEKTQRFSSIEDLGIMGKMIFLKICLFLHAIDQCVDRQIILYLRYVNANKALLILYRLHVMVLAMQSL